MSKYYPILLWQTYLDEERTKLCWEAHALFEERGISCIGQGSTPKRAVKEVREMIVSVLEHFTENGLPAPKPRRMGFPVKFGMRGDLEMFYPPHRSITTTCNGTTVSYRAEIGEA